MMDQEKAALSRRPPPSYSESTLRTPRMSRPTTPIGTMSRGVCGEGRQISLNRTPSEDDAPLSASLQHPYSMRSTYDDDEDDESAGAGTGEHDVEKLLTSRTSQSPTTRAVASPRTRLMRIVRVGAALSLAGLILVAVLQFVLPACHGKSNSNTAEASLWSWSAATSEENVASRIAKDGNVIYGMAMGDVTGPIVNVNQMGYASLPQTNTGLHIRLRSRAFIVGSPSSGSATSQTRRQRRGDRKHTRAVVNKRLTGGLFGGFDNDHGDQGADPVDGLEDRWVFINSDICMGDTAIRRAVIEQLRVKYPGLYGERNLAFVGTHSHSGIAGFLNGLLPTLTSKGVVQDSFDAIVQGTVVAVERAHDDYEARRGKSGATASANKLLFGTTVLKGAHINRSKYSYLLNPKAERDMYDSDQEDEFALLRFEDGGAVPSGFLSWYAVHGTSLYENNTLTSADNKGLAALYYESSVEPDVLPGQNKFIAGFSQSSVGDTSPNVQGAFCLDGSPCDAHHSTCPDKNGKPRVEDCHGRGPAWGDAAALAVSPTGGYDWASNERIAQMQADAAKGLVEQDASSLTAITGPVKAVKLNVDMSNYTFKLNGRNITTCPAALGYGFAGGTTDGPGAFDFLQGANDTDPHNPLWDIVKSAIKAPTKAQVECQKPKRVLLDIGETHLPYEWGPSIVETQMLRVGQLFIIIAPGEFTTMSGRRIRKAVGAAITKNKLLPKGVTPIVQISGPANTYGHYIATPEEYVAQRYEGSSTLFGQHTLDAYIDIYSNVLVPQFKDGAKPLAPGKLATYNINKALKLTPGVIYDNPPLAKKFGDVLQEPAGLYSLPGGSDATLPTNVTVSFVGANPRNDRRQESTFFEFLRLDDGADPSNDASWKVLRTDGHHTTTMRWTQTNELHGSSRVDVAWAIEKDAKVGTYRAKYYGASKTPVTGKIKPFTATSANFVIQS